MKSRMDLSLELAQDRNAAKLTLRAEERHLYIDLDSADVDVLIERLGQIRAQMSTPIPVERDPNIIIDAVQDPAWRAGSERVQGRRLLTLLHPGFGWQNFALPDHEAKAIAAFLTEDLA